MRRFPTVTAGALRAAPLLVFLTAAALAAQQITLDDGVFRVAPAPPGAVLRVTVDTPGDPPPLLGAARREGGAIVFEPRFALEEGLSYRVVYRASPSAPPLERTFAIPKRERPPTTFVERIYPTAGTLPENQLKFYLYFSAPMSRGEVYRRVRLADAEGKQVKLPFLEIEQELWDRDGKRLTLLFDPGRIKRDLLPHEQVGLPIVAGKSYTLTIDPGWPDAEGRPLVEEARKSFRAAPADRNPPEVKTWRLSPPRAGTRDPLAVLFPEPLDRALLERVIEVATASRRPIRGVVAIDREETRWRFTPEKPWKAGRYLLRAETILEDLAGNSLGRPFEVDEFNRAEERVAGVTADLKFTVR